MPCKVLVTTVQQHSTKMEYVWQDHISSYTEPYGVSYLKKKVEIPAMALKAYFTFDYSINLFNQQIIIMKTKKTTSARAVAKKAPPVKKAIPATKAAASKKIKAAAAHVKETPIDHFIPIALAKQMIIKANAAGAIKPMLFHRNIIEEILKQPSVVYLKIYAAINERGKATYVVMGGAPDESDVYIRRKKNKTKAPLTASAIPLPQTQSGSGDYEEGAADMAQVCDPVKQVYGRTGD